MQTNGLETHLHTLAILLANVREVHGCDIRDIDSFFDVIARLILEPLDKEFTDKDEKAMIEQQVKNWSLLLC